LGGSSLRSALAVNGEDASKNRVRRFGRCGLDPEFIHFSMFRIAASARGTAMAAYFENGTEDPSNQHKPVLMLGGARRRFTE
jgi:hypothetical protein